MKKKVTASIKCIIFEDNISEFQNPACTASLFVFQTEVELDKLIFEHDTMMSWVRKNIFTLSHHLSNVVISCLLQKIFNLTSHAPHAACNTP